eukprot:ANDGO_08204.mRNA.1 Guanine nucleotide-binding protein subunit gamma
MDYQLRQQQEENARLKQELEIAKRAIKSSEACATLIKAVSETKDPFLPGWDNVTNPNKWKESPSGGGCCSVM